MLGAPHLSSDTFREFWCNLKFYQKGIPGKHMVIYQIARWTLQGKELKSDLNLWDTDCICCERNWNSLSVCVHAAWVLSVQARWAKPYLTASKSFSGFCFLLYWETTSDPAEIHTHICRSEFRAPICKAFRSISLATTEKTIHLSRLPPPIFNF